MENIRMRCRVDANLVGLELAPLRSVFGQNFLSHHGTSSPRTISSSSSISSSPSRRE